MGIMNCPQDFVYNYMFAKVMRPPVDQLSQPPPGCEDEFFDYQMNEIFTRPKNGGRATSWAGADEGAQGKFLDALAKRTKSANASHTSGKMVLKLKQYADDELNVGGLSRTDQHKFWCK